MQRMLLITTLLIGVCLSSVALGAPNQTEAYLNSHVYFRLDSTGASVKATRDNPDSTIATLKLQVKFDDTLFRNDSLNDIYAKVTFNDSLLQFIDGHRDAANWSADSNILDTFVLDGTGTVKIVMKQGAKPVPKDSFKVYAYLRFYSKCQTPGRMDTVIITPTSTITYISTMRNRINNQFYAPADGSHFGVGRVRSNHISATFTIGSATVSNASGSEVWLPVLSSRNANLSSTKHYITWDSTRLQWLDWANGSHEWSIAFPEPIDGGLFSFVGLSNCFGETALDTLYKIKFRLLCGSSAQREDTLKFIYTDTGALYNRCFCARQDQFVYSRGYIHRRDSARFCGALSDASDAVGKTQDTIAYSIQLANTFVCGYGANAAVPDSGIVVNFETRSTRLTVRNQNTLDSVGSLHFDNGIGGSGQRLQAFQQWNSTPAQRARAVSETPTTLFRAKLSWNPGGSYVPRWDTQYVYPQFIDTIQALNGRFTRTHDTTGCFAAKRTTTPALLSFGPVAPVRIRMGRYLSGADYGQTCVDGVTSLSQKLYLKTNWFPTGPLDTVCGFRIKIWPPSGAFMSVSVTEGYDIQDSAMAGGAHLIKRDSASSTHGLPADSVIATVLMSRGGPCGADIGVVIDSAQYSVIRSKHGLEYVAAPVRSTAYTRCDLMCLDRGLEGMNAGENQLPKEFSLDQNFPNPFNPVTRINLNLPSTTPWKITIYNLSGQVVKEFAGSSPAGKVSVTWDGSRCASGIYFYKAVAGEFVATRKMILLK